MLLCRGIYTEISMQTISHTETACIFSTAAIFLTDVDITDMAVGYFHVQSSPHSIFSTCLLNGMDPMKIDGMYEVSPSLTSS